MYCRYCGNLLSKEQKSCGNCGATIKDTVAEKRANISLIIGIVVFFLSGLNILILPVAIVGLIIGLCSKGKDPKKIAGIVLNAFCIVFVIFYTMPIISSLIKFTDNNGILIDKYINNDDLKNIINKFTDWNRYSYLRENGVGEVMDLHGGWSVLSNDGEYIVFKDDYCYVYDSIYAYNSRNIEDKYTVNRVVIERGLDALKNHGIEDEDINKAFSTIPDYIDMENIFIVTYPEIKKTNNTENIEVWLLIEHEREGIQAIRVNLINESINSYIKLEDDR